MSDCGVCLYGDESSWDGYIDEASIVTLAVDKRCCECGKTVKAGQPIEEASWMQDEDEWETDDEGEPVEPEAKEPIYTCVICAEIGDAFYCEGRVYNGDLWDALYELFGELSTTCFDKLKTPEAKAELRRRWMQWKGLAA